jgi:hypothetical protein
MSSTWKSSKILDESRSSGFALSASFISSDYAIESGVIHAPSSGSASPTQVQRPFDAGSQIGAGSEALDGGYAVLSETQNFTVANLNTLANQLTDGYWNYVNREYRSFDIAPGGTITANITALTTEGQQFAQWALEAWTAVSGINFSYTSGAANIAFDDSDSGAYSSSQTDSNHNILSSFVNVSVDWIAGEFTKDTYSLQTYIHEIGHAIGLGHAGDYNGSATYGVHNKFTFDSWQTSVMSYFSQYENTDLTADFAYLLTPMAADVIAIRNLYGTVAIRDGDNNYAFDDSIFANSVARTIVDTGGTDTLDYSAYSVSQVLDLRDGFYSDVAGIKWGVVETLQGNLGISVGTIIENAYSGSGDDKLIGNSANNYLKGGGGTDTAVFTGAFANYTVTYNSGDNTYTVTALSGTDGTDTLFDVEKIKFSDGVRDLSHPPTVAHPIDDQAGSTNQAFNFQFAANTFEDIDSGDVLTYSATQNNGSALPAWLHFDAATRTFSGTPTNGDVGTVVVKVTASDGTWTVSDVFNIAIGNSNHVPTVANPISNQSATEDQAFDFTFAANVFNDADGDTLTYTATLDDGTTLPSWLHFDAATRTFTGTPLNDNVGTISVKVTASDGFASVTNTFSLIVANSNDAPTLENPIDNQNTTAGEDFNFTFAANVFDDVDANDILTYSATLADGSELPSWLEFDAATRTFSGTPASGDVGTVSVKVTASDGLESVSDTFNIVIKAENHPPIVANPIANQAATEDLDFDFTFDADVFSDTDGDTLTYSATLEGGGELPSWLEFDAATRTFSGRPANGDVGPINVKVTASDGKLTVSDVFVITVANTNDAPTLDHPIDDQTATRGEEFTFTFAANVFGDVDAGDTLTYSAALEDGGDLPPWLEFDAATRTFSGTPDNSVVGPISVRVTASDGDDAKVSDVFEIAVQGDDNHAPTDLNLDNNSVWENSEGGTLVGNLSATDPDSGDSLTYSIVDPSGNFVIDGTSLEVADGATLDYEGIQHYTVTIRATDEGGLFVEQDFVIDIGDLVTVINGHKYGETLVGTIGQDRIRGFGGNDKLRGLAGSDTLDGGKNNDQMTGGGGVDTFVFGKKYGTDKIIDFDTDALTHDKIDLSNAVGINNFRDLVRNHAEGFRGNLFIDADDGSTLVLMRTAERDLDSSMFVF